jgi:hypothetical protein
MSEGWLWRLARSASLSWISWARTAATRALPDRVEYSVRAIVAYL